MYVHFNGALLYSQMYMYSIPPPSPHTKRADTRSKQSANRCTQNAFNITIVASAIYYIYTYILGESM